MASTQFAIDLVDAVRLALVSGVGPRHRQDLLARFGSPAAVLAASRDDLQQVPGIGPKLAEGDIVLCYAWTLSAVLARVAKLSSGQEIEVQYDWAGTTKNSTIEHCQPPLGGLESQR